MASKQTIKKIKKKGLFWPLVAVIAILLIALGFGGYTLIQNRIKLRNERLAGNSLISNRPDAVGYGGQEGDLYAMDEDENGRKTSSGTKKLNDYDDTYMDADQDGIGSASGTNGAAGQNGAAGINGAAGKNGTNSSSTMTGQNGKLYTMDEDQNERKPYGGNKAMESGYDTSSLNTGTASKLSELQDEIDALKNGDGSSESATYEKDIRGKVDYSTLNNAVQETTENVGNKLTEYEQVTTTQIGGIRTLIASNKSDTDSKIKRLEDSLSSNNSKTESISTTVKDNQNSAKKLVDELDKKTSKEIEDSKKDTDTKINKATEATDKKVSELEKKTAATAESNKNDTDKKLAALEKAINTTITNNYSTINNTINDIKGGTTAVLIGTYDKTNNKFTIKGGE